MTTSRKRKTPARSQAARLLEELGGPLTLASLLQAIRQGEGMSQADFAEKLDLSRSHLCDIERGRKTVSPARAAKFARVLGFSEKQFVRLALQKLIDEAGLDLIVRVDAA